MDWVRKQIRDGKPKMSLVQVQTNKQTNKQKEEQKRRLKREKEKPEGKVC